MPKQVDNYIRVGSRRPNLEIFCFDSGDPSSVQRAKDGYKAALKQIPKGPVAIWKPHREFEDCPIVGLNSRPGIIRDRFRLPDS